MLCNKNIQEQDPTVALNPENNRLIDIHFVQNAMHIGINVERKTSEILILQKPLFI